MMILEACDDRMVSSTNAHRISLTDHSLRRSPLQQGIQGLTATTECRKYPTGLGDIMSKHPCIGMARRDSIPRSCR
jgi:hypothetical protein